MGTCQTCHAFLPAIPHSGVCLPPMYAYHTLPTLFVRVGEQVLPLAAVPSTYSACNQKTTSFCCGVPLNNVSPCPIWVRPPTVQPCCCITVVNTSSDTLRLPTRTGPPLHTPLCGQSPRTYRSLARGLLCSGDIPLYHFCHALTSPFCPMPVVVAEFTPSPYVLFWGILCPSYSPYLLFPTGPAPYTYLLVT